MKAVGVIVVVALVALTNVANAFMAPVGLGVSARTRMQPLQMGYVPDGLSPEEWKKIQDKEKAKKDLGAIGPKRFKSRSFDAWYKSGGKHLFPVDPKKVKSGEIAPEDVPYMQRGGSWDNSDLIKKGIKAKKVEWNEKDKQYAAGGYKKEQSVSIFGGVSMPWTQSYQKMQKDSLTEITSVGKKFERGKVAPNEKKMAELAKKKAQQQKKLEDEVVKEKKKSWFFGR